jgi:uncharacterized membrane protein YkvA (DUF1232 family)
MGAMPEEARFAPDLLRWIESFPREIETIREALLDKHPPPVARRLLVGVLTYRVRQMDLIPDYMNPVGLVDDCLVVRVAAELFLKYNVEGLPLPTLQKVARLANDAETVKAFLGDALFEALEQFVAKLPDQPFRDLTPEQILSDERVRGRLFIEVNDSLKGWKVPPVDDPARMERDAVNYLKDKLGAR